MTKTPACVARRWPDLEADPTGDSAELSGPPNSSTGATTTPIIDDEKLSTDLHQALRHTTPKTRAWCDQNEQIVPGPDSSEESFFANDIHQKTGRGQCCLALPFPCLNEGADHALGPPCRPLRNNDPDMIHGRAPLWAVSNCTHLRSSHSSVGSEAPCSGKILGRPTDRADMNQNKYPCCFESNMCQNISQ